MAKRLSISLCLGVSLMLISPAHAQAPITHKQLPKPFNMALSYPKTYAKKILTLKGLGKDQYACLVKLWERESHWNYKAKNSSSTAFGIGQLLIETSKDPATQIRNGIRYIEYRYGSPCKALRHSYRLGWY